MPAHQNKDIDMCLSVLCLVTPEHHTWSTKDLAEICGCSHQTIKRIENMAIQKLKTSTMKDYANVA